MLKIRVKLYFSGRAHPIEVELNWPEAELPSPGEVLTELKKAGKLLTADGAVVSWDPEPAEFVRVELSEETAE
jgi:hypothetical protein